MRFSLKQSNHPINQIIQKINDLGGIVHREVTDDLLHINNEITASVVISSTPNSIQNVASVTQFARIMMLRFRDI